ncbi:MAG: hypothetical protein M1828_000360 [Chrysothrix sp. TS-e1954]|nr:MAG: hypothetical protein M1828_000360 [Chrysothrix sp. TS-e1954]
MATYDPRIQQGPPPHQQSRHRRNSSVPAGTAPIPIPQPRAYPPPPVGQPSLSNSVRPEHGYLPEPSVPISSAAGSYGGPTPQAPPGYASQNYEPQPPLPPSSYPAPQAAGQYPYPPSNGVLLPPGAAPAPQPQPQSFAPLSYPHRPRGDSQRSSYSGRSDNSPARPVIYPGTHQAMWLPTTYEHQQPAYDRRSSYDYAPYQTLSHDAPPRRDRRASYAHRREYDEDDRYDRDDSSDSRSETERERRKRKSRKSKAHKDLDKKPTLADSTIWAWDQLKDVVKGKS